MNLDYSPPPPILLYIFCISCPVSCDFLKSISVVFLVKYKAWVSFVMEERAKVPLELPQEVSIFGGAISYAQGVLAFA